jgi:predicted Zn-dependent protease with MMP-like domain
VAHHVSSTRFAELVEKALSDIPEPFASHLEKITLEIKRRPSRKMLKEEGLEEDELLMGLYVGVPLTERHDGVEGGMDRIYIFQEDIELCCESEDELVKEVRVTVLHEIGHYFGMDEDDLDELGYR